MTDLPSVAAAPYLSDEDLRDLLADVPPGRYVTRNLYPRYEAWASVRPSHLPVTRKAFGMALRRFLGEPVGYAHGHVAVFQII